MRTAGVGEYWFTPCAEHEISDANKPVFAEVWGCIQYNENTILYIWTKDNSAGLRSGASIHAAIDTK